MASRHTKLHGRVEGATAICAAPGCENPGEFRAPLRPANFDGPGMFRLLCLDHVREHNARYNYFDGMSPEEITQAQSSIAGWERSTRAFASPGADPAPAWRDFADPLDAIAARFRPGSGQSPGRFNRSEQRALAILGLGEDVDRRGLRRRYSELLRRFHPDRNGGDRSHEKRLSEVIEAYQQLKGSTAFA